MSSGTGDLLQGTLSILILKALLAAPARLRHRALGRGGYRRRAAHRGRLALSGAPATGGSRAGYLRVGPEREQPASAVLHRHAGGPRLLAHRGDDVAPLLRRRHPRAAHGMSLDRSAWRRQLRLWRPDVAADVGDEIGFHVDMLARDYEARAAAQQEGVHERPRAGPALRMRVASWSAGPAQFAERPRLLPGRAPPSFAGGNLSFANSST